MNNWRENFTHNKVNSTFGIETVIQCLKPDREPKVAKYQLTYDVRKEDGGKKFKEIPFDTEYQIILLYGRKILATIGFDVNTYESNIFIKNIHKKNTRN